MLTFDGGSGAALVNIDNSSESFEIDGRSVLLVTNTIFNVMNFNGAALIDSVLTGAGSLIKNGAGQLVLTGTNSTTGTMFIQGGILIAEDDAALGSSSVTIINEARFRSVGTVNNTIDTLGGATGISGAAIIEAALFETMTLTGTLGHISQGRLSFGSNIVAGGGASGLALAAGSGTVIASFTNVVNNATTSIFTVAAGTLVMGNSYSAANLFERAGNGATEISSGATLNTGGFATIISNLDMDGGTILSGPGALNVTVNDTGVVLNSQTGTITGTAGADSFTVNANGSFGLASLTFSSWTAGTDLITLNGSANSNILGGTGNRDTINGFGGSDFLTGNGGIDTIDGGAGNDSIILNAANGGSFVHGGADSDTLTLAGTVSLGAVSGFEALALSGGATYTTTGAQFAGGFNLFSTLSGSGTIIVNLSAGDTILNARGMSGGATVNFIVNGSIFADSIKIALGTAGTITGGIGTDIIVGGNLDDTIDGGVEIDKIRGGGGADTLTGGAGPDVFKYRDASDSGIGVAADIITDFVSGSDRLNFARIDTNSGLAGDQGFAFVGIGAFIGGGTASIRYVDLGADLRVDADVNGDGTADMHILLQGAGAGVLTAADFVL
jgi:autotransporter-associated beta strand protein